MMMELDPAYSKAFYDVFWGLLIQDQAPKNAIRFLGPGRTPDPKPVKPWEAEGALIQGPHLFLTPRLLGGV